MKKVDYQDEQLDLIYAVVENVCGVELRLKTRKRKWVFSRALFYRIAWEYNHDLASIGSYVNLDHATVLHGLGIFKKDLINSPEWSSKYLESTETIKNVMFSKVKKKKGIIDAGYIIRRNTQLIEEVQSLKIKLSRTEIALKRSYTPEDPIEREFLEIMSNLDYEGKKDILFKAKTLLKVRSKLDDRIFKARQIHRKTKAA